jgi:WD40 repeat protein
VTLWDARTLSPAGELRRLEGFVFSQAIAYSPDGSLLAVGWYGGTATLLSTRTWKQVGRRLEGHRARLTALEFSPDGSLLATGSADGTVLLWDVRTQRPLGSSLTIEPDSVGRQAVLARVPADAAAERVAGDADVRCRAVQRGEAECGGARHDVRPARAGADARDAPLDVDLDAL